MWTYALQDHSWTTLQWGTVLGASLAACVWDLRSRRIPNLLTLPLFLGGLGFATLVAGPVGFLDGLVASLVLALPYVVLFAFAGGGAGDAKIMGALGAWLGLVHGTAVLMAVCLAGVVLAVSFAALRRRLGVLRTNLSGVPAALLYPLFGGGSFRDVGRMIPSVEEGEKMPYGTAIFLGTFIAALGVFPWQG